MYSRLIKQYLLEIILFATLLIFSVWLMFSTFSYKQGSMLIASKAWSDFAQHIPLIRSFSFGYNFPPQDPLFAGYPIHYHFLFYVLVGMLEWIGIRIDYALNVPSMLGFFALLVMVYCFAVKIFKSKTVGILSIIFFLFNGSLSFLEFFKKYPLSFHTLTDISTLTVFPSFGPYTRTIVSAFWNLNIYTNQRHLAAAYGLSLLLIYVLLFYCYRQARDNNKNSRIDKSAITDQELGNEKTVIHPSLFLIHFLDNLGISKKHFKQTNFVLSFAVGLILGASFFFHLAVFLMTVVIIVCIFLLFPKLRFASTSILLTTAIIAFPQYNYLQTGATAFKLQLSPGYLAQEHITFLSFITYWFFNFGLHIFTIPIGFLLAPKQAKKLFIAFFSLFAIGNLFQFGPEMAGNHKFFNEFMLYSNMLSAVTIVYLWKKATYIKILAILVTFFLIFSGIIDFFPLYNDTKIALTDYPINPDIQWVIKSTPPQTTFLNTSYLYDTVSLAGRKIFLGWPYFPWSEGFDTTTRSNSIKSFFTLENKSGICSFLVRNNLSYIELATPSPDFPFNATFWKQNFSPAYVNPQTNFSIYKTTDICR